MTAPATAYAPEDAGAFVARAAAISNRRERHALEEVFAATARWTALIDGLTFTATGHHEITLRWAQLCGYMDRRGMVVTKHVIARDEHTIVSGWTGENRDGTSSFGQEVWRFDRHGDVADSVLIGALDPLPADSLRGGFRWIRADPRNAFRFALSRFTTTGSIQLLRHHPLRHHQE